MEKPFQELGGELKTIREKLCESLVEVSGAVEIDSKVLERIEAGHERPNEDVLMLMISHFDIQDDEAVELWELAGYDRFSKTRSDPTDDLQGRPVVMMMALDTRILYSDSAHINANKNGLVLNFLQNSGNTSQQVPIARIGMSYDQAHEILQVLAETLNRAKSANQPKALPAPKQKTSRNNKTDMN
jgi:hypothetical protein